MLRSLLDQGDGQQHCNPVPQRFRLLLRAGRVKSMDVTVKDRFCPYLVSTSDIQFSKGDAVSAKAAELCKNAKTDEEKVVAIYNYMADRYSYDYKLANEITSGTTGMCYDFLSPARGKMPQRGHPVRTDQGLRRLQLSRMEQRPT